MSSYEIEKSLLLASDVLSRDLRGYPLEARLTSSIEDVLQSLTGGEAKLTPEQTTRIHSRSGGVYGNSRGHAAASSRPRVQTSVAYQGAPPLDEATASVCLQFASRIHFLCQCLGDKLRRPLVRVDECEQVSTTQLMEAVTPAQVGNFVLHCCETMCKLLGVVGKPRHSAALIAEPMRVLREVTGIEANALLWSRSFGAEALAVSVTEVCEALMREVRHIEPVDLRSDAVTYFVMECLDVDHDGVIELVDISMIAQATPLTRIIEGEAAKLMEVRAKNSGSSRGSSIPLTPHCHSCDALQAQLLVAQRTIAALSAKLRDANGTLRLVEERFGRDAVRPVSSSTSIRLLEGKGSENCIREAMHHKQGANMQGANMQGANMQGANIQSLSWKSLRDVTPQTQHYKQSARELCLASSATPLLPLTENCVKSMRHPVASPKQSHQGMLEARVESGNDVLEHRWSQRTEVDALMEPLQRFELSHATPNLPKSLYDDD